MSSDDSAAAAVASPMGLASLASTGGATGALTGSALGLPSLAGRRTTPAAASPRSGTSSGSGSRGAEGKREGSRGELTVGHPGGGGRVVLRVALALDGEQVLKMAERTRYAVYFLDLYMDRLSGAPRCTPTPTPPPRCPSPTHQPGPLPGAVCPTG